MTDTKTNNADSTTDLELKKIMGAEVNPQNLKEKFLLATFQIIAESGADALSANELIKKTQSSKGALFHHFKTLDDLCLESLNFLRTRARMGLPRSEYNSLKEFLSAFVKDSYERQCNRAFFHITHFFRDKALKDDRFKAAYNELYSNYTEALLHLVKKYLPTDVDPNQVRELMIFMYLSLERMWLWKVTSSQAEDTESLVRWFIDVIEERFKTLKST